MNKYRERKKYVFYFSVIGSVVGLFIHLNSLIYEYFVQINFYFFILGLLLIIFLGYNACPELRPKDVWEGYDQRFYPIKSFRLNFKNAPVWLRIMYIASVLYLFFNFFNFLTLDGTPDIINGQYGFYHKGQLVKNLTEREYRQAMIIQTKTMSALWFVVYYGFTGMLYPVLNKQADNKNN